MMRADNTGLFLLWGGLLTLFIGHTADTIIVRLFNVKPVAI